MLLKLHYFAELLGAAQARGRSADRSFSLRHSQLWSARALIASLEAFCQSYTSLVRFTTEIITLSEKR